ncbi:MAG TPA: A/G-specific adenine glycosylase [Bacteroidales bacterium]|nr:A/G-specific adenine glycosylase [Bacteroidales bacterium]
MSFSDKIIGWYKKNKRDLPWRNTKDSYKIWVSEVILQQTRVEYGKPYYERFLKRFPDIFVLASAREDELLKLWQGLGYYSRARNMLLAAREIVTGYNGIFPSSYDEMTGIKGIGKYTASAILSFANNLPYPVMDGNVKRVISRYFGITRDIKSSAGEKLITEKLAGVFDKKRSADFNQAIMEFGALHCRVKNPECSTCIFKTGCKAFKTGKVSELPVVSRKIKIKVRHFHYIVPVLKTKRKVYTYIIKRKSDDIWKHLFQFPLIETEKKLATGKLLDSGEFRALLNNGKYRVVRISPVYAHKLSHQLINAVFIHIRIFEDIGGTELIKIDLDDLKNYPVSRLTEGFLEQNKISDF